MLASNPLLSAGRGLCVHQFKHLRVAVPPSTSVQGALAAAAASSKASKGPKFGSSGPPPSAYPSAGMFAAGNTNEAYEGPTPQSGVSPPSLAAALEQATATLLAFCPEFAVDGVSE
jgi:hypothetical protein